MEEIKVGEYVRTENGEIHKVKDIEDLRIHIETEKIMFRSWVEDYYGCHKEDRFIVKHSPNLIDLIEVGDIIKTKHPAFEKFYYEHIWNKEYLEHIAAFLKEKSLIIKSIVTHEQFAQIEYKVEE